MPLSSRRRIIFYMDAKTLAKFLAKYPLERRSKIAKQAFLDFVDGKTRAAQSAEIPAHRWKFHSERTLGDSLILIYRCRRCPAICRAAYKLGKLSEVKVLNPFREKRE